MYYNNERFVELNSAATGKRKLVNARFIVSVEEHSSKQSVVILNVCGSQRSYLFSNSYEDICSKLRVLGSDEIVISTASSVDCSTNCELDGQTALF